MPEFEPYQLLGILLLVATAVLFGYALGRSTSRRRHAQESFRQLSEESADTNTREESLHNDQDDPLSAFKEGEICRGRCHEPHQLWRFC